MRLRLYGSRALAAWRLLHDARGSYLQFALEPHCLRAGMCNPCQIARVRPLRLPQSLEEVAAAKAAIPLLLEAGDYAGGCGLVWASVSRRESTMQMQRDPAKHNHNATQTQRALHAHTTRTCARYPTHNKSWHCS